MMTGYFAESAEWAAGVACAWLGWRPAEFWGATPAELAMALKGFRPAAGDCEAMTGAGLERLRERFPDG